MCVYGTTENYCSQKGQYKPDIRLYIEKAEHAEKYKRCKVYQVIHIDSGISRLLPFRFNIFIIHENLTWGKRIQKQVTIVM